MDLKHVVAGLKGAVDKGLATHIAWIARDFGRRDMSLFSPVDMDALQSMLEVVHVPAGHRVLSPGQQADAAYIVESGEIELLIRRGHRRSLVGIQHAGGVFGDVPLLCDMPFPFVALARTEATLLKLDKTNLVDLLTHHPAIALRWLTNVVRRLEHANRRIVELTVGDLHNRVLALLADEVSRGDAPMEIKLTQSEMAALLGATRQHVGRVLRDLSQKGLIEQQYGRIDIADPRRLLEVSGVTPPSGTC